jgi:hypothetical protein
MPPVNKPRSRLRPGKKCKACKGKGCPECKGLGFIVKKKPKTERKKPKPKSKSHAINLEYGRLRKQFMLEHRQCQFVDEAGVRCREASTECHHRRGRGKYMLEVSTWMALCSQCHRRIHENPKMAKSLGYLHNPLSIRPLPDLPIQNQDARPYAYSPRPTKAANLNNEATGSTPLL